MEVIQQTNRTILFEEINPEKLDLISVIGDTKGLNSLNDDKVKEINDYFLVNSFDEFLEKFAPVVYSFFNASNQKVMYTLKKPEGISDELVTEIPINQSNDFLKMLFTLIDTKRAQGIANVDFKFENLLDMISPKKVMDDIKQTRKEIQYTYSKYEALEDEDPSKLDLGDKLNIMFEEASSNYNNIMAMLPLAIEDIKTRLLLGAEDNKNGNDCFQIGVLSMGGNGELKVLEAPKVEEKSLVAIDDKANVGLMEAFQDDYDDINEVKSDYVKSLVIRTFCPLVSTMESSVNLDVEVENYNTYLEFYKSSKDDFIKTVKPLIEKILGVKMFFDQYKTKNKGMKPSLLITNTKLNRLVSSNNLPRLNTFLSSVNDKNDFDNTIWFGIVPSIELEGQSKNKVIRERFKSNKQIEKTDSNSMEDLAMLLDTVQKYRIQIFFSFEPREDTTFNHVATAGIDKFIDKCSPLLHNTYSEFAIPCIPNFTVIPKEKSGVILDKRMILSQNGSAELSKEKEDILKLWIEGVYIGSSYISAGIVAAYQCPEYLREYYDYISSEYPGVRFDIESGSNALKITTTLAKEISGFTNEIKNLINKRNFGFVFSSENAQLQGKDIKQITVYKARSLQATENDFESIYKTLVTTYIERILRFHTNDFKEDNIVRFFSNNPTSVKSKWMANKEYCNSIIQDGDDINFVINDKTGKCNIDLVFNGNVKNLEVEITRNDVG
ncbi:transcriptional regulator [Clostridium gasigenes]|uniref:transcriptional regulator n=1 Tax=Clostridium gasigenes TaxID=94869 RepID=UPI001628A3E9|nr:transcriptional regulator [Clostridium gasigenes]MBB6624526.1 transcriptional regulator [Clostridium gasigenes]